jgi:hypothetical protein
MDNFGNRFWSTYGRKSTVYLKQEHYLDMTIIHYDVQYFDLPYL